MSEDDVKAALNSMVSNKTSVLTVNNNQDEGDFFRLDSSPPRITKTATRGNFDNQSAVADFVWADTHVVHIT